MTLQYGPDKQLSPCEIQSCSDMSKMLGHPLLATLCTRATKLYAASTRPSQMRILMPIPFFYPKEYSMRVMTNWDVIFNGIIQPFVHSKYDRPMIQYGPDKQLSPCEIQSCSDMSKILGHPLLVPKIYQKMVKTHSKSFQQGNYISDNFKLTLLCHF